MTLLVSLSCFSQDVKIITTHEGTVEAELKLILTNEGKEKVIQSFTQPLMLYFHHSYYIDQKNRVVYFLSAVCTNLGINGKMGFRYCLEKFDISSEKLTFMTCCDVVETAENNTIYHITDDGYLERNFDGVKTLKSLTELGKTYSWCE